MADLSVYQKITFTMKSQKSHDDDDESWLNEPLSGLILFPPIQRKMALCARRHMRARCLADARESHCSCGLHRENTTVALRTG